MAKYLAQLIVAGTQVVARAFARAVKQEIEASQQAAKNINQNHAKTRSERIANQKLGLSLEEAQQILNVRKLDKDEVEQRFQALFKANENTSLYIQSKIVRAKERLDHELTNLDLGSGQKPKENEAGSKT